MRVMEKGPSPKQSHGKGHLTIEVYSVYSSEEIAGQALRRAKWSPNRFTDFQVVSVEQPGWGQIFTYDIRSLVC